MSLRPCSLCGGVFPLLPMAHLFIRYAANSTSQQNTLVSGGTLAPMRCSSAAFSVLPWLATSPRRALNDPVGLTFSHWRSLKNRLLPFLTCLCDFPCQCPDRCINVASERNPVVATLATKIIQRRMDRAESGKDKTRSGKVAAVADGGQRDCSNYDQHELFVWDHSAIEWRLCGGRNEEKPG